MTSPIFILVVCLVAAASAQISILPYPFNQIGAGLGQIFPPPFTFPNFPGGQQIISNLLGPLSNLFRPRPVVIPPPTAPPSQTGEDGNGVNINVEVTQQSIPTIPPPQSTVGSTSNLEQTGINQGNVEISNQGNVELGTQTNLDIDEQGNADRDALLGSQTSNQGNEEFDVLDNLNTGNQGNVGNISIAVDPAVTAATIIEQVSSEEDEDNEGNADNVNIDQDQVVPLPQVGTNNQPLLGSGMGLILQPVIPQTDPTNPAPGLEQEESEFSAEFHDYLLNQNINDNGVLDVNGRK